MLSRASKAVFVFSHGREGVCKKAVLGGFVSRKAAVDTTDVEGAESALDDVIEVHEMLLRAKPPL